MRYVREILTNRYVLGLLAGVAVLFGASFFLPADLRAFVRYFDLLALACNTIPIPAQPAVIFMGKTYPWLAVALVGAAATTLANLLDYQVFSTVLKVRLLRRIREHPHSQATIRTFRRLGFPALVAANVVVFSFDLVRLVAIAAEYPRLKYAAATFLGRTVRYAILAALGTIFQPPWWALLILTGVLALPALFSWLAAKRRAKQPVDAPPEDAGGG